MSDTDDDSPPGILINDSSHAKFVTSSSTYNPSQSTLRTPIEDELDQRTEPLLSEYREGQPSARVLTKRKYVDVPAACAFLFCFLLMLIIGISSHFSKRKTIEPIQGSVLGFLFSTIYLSIVPIIILGFLTALMGLLWAYLIRRVIKPTVWVTVCSIPAFFIISSGWCFYSSVHYSATRTSSILMGLLLLASGISSFFFVRRYIDKNINITVKLMEVACEVLAEHPSIFGISAVVTSIYILFSAIWLWIFSRSFMLGKVEEEDSEQYWVFNTESYFVMLFSIFVFLWTSAIVTNIQTYTLSGIACTWYFERGNGNIKTGNIAARSLTQSVTTSFGSICMASLVVSTTNMAQIIASVLSRIQFKNYPRVRRFVDWIVNLIYRFTELITKYAIVYCAIRGEPFIKSSKEVFSILKRNSFERITIDLFARFALWVWCCSVSSLFALFINSYGIRKLESIYGWTSASLGFAVCYFVMCFFSEILLKVIDALFVCYFVEMSDTNPQDNIQENENIRKIFISTIQSTPKGREDSGYKQNLDEEEGGGTSEEDNQEIQNVVDDDDDDDDDPKLHGRNEQMDSLLN